MNRRLATLLAALATLLALSFPSLEVDAAVKCQHQRPQGFLVRSFFIRKGRMDPRRHEQAVRYRTERYGHVEGFGSPSWNKHEPRTFAEQTTFFGLKVELHQKVVPALACVEQEIKAKCKEEYTPKALGGFRDHNSYRGGEVTNHLFGIALDIDPDRNPCCHCVEPWSDDPQCQKKVKSAYERAAMPRCWIETFEGNGFYWLGHDDLEDTMHFEFLGNPAKVVK